MDEGEVELIMRTIAENVQSYEQVVEVSTLSARWPCVLSLVLMQDNPPV